VLQSQPTRKHEGSRQDSFIRRCGHVVTFVNYNNLIAKVNELLQRAALQPMLHEARSIHPPTSCMPATLHIQPLEQSACIFWMA